MELYRRKQRSIFKYQMLNARKKVHNGMDKDFEADYFYVQHFSPNLRNAVFGYCTCILDCSIIE